MTDWQDAVILMTAPNKKIKNRQKKKENKKVKKGKKEKKENDTINLEKKLGVGLRCWECGLYLENMKSGQLCNSCLIKYLKKIAKTPQKGNNARRK